MGVVFRPDPRRAARTTRSNTAPAMPLVMRSIYDAKHPPGSGPILLPTSGRRTRRPWHRQNQPRYLLRLIQLGQICRLDAFEDFSDAGAHQAPYAGDAPAGEIGSQRTLRWRKQSGANSSLWGANFPASWENTGKFIDSGFRHPNLPSKARLRSKPYRQIPCAAEQGINCVRAGN